MRTLADIGEFGVIARIEKIAGRGRARGVELGIGDDAAVLRPPAGERLLVTTDALVEDVHFRWRTQAPLMVGRRALVVNLSDLAAMGARPLACVLALAAPPALPVKVLDGLLRGLAAEAERHGCPLVGGNVARARQTSLSVTVLGSAKPGQILTRRGARAGDRLLVTGTLGGAALEVARGGLIRRLPEPRLAAGRALARTRGIGACIDVSDGLEADLGQLLEAASAPLAAVLDPERIPIPRGFAAACRRARLDPGTLARSGGEDYELLFTVRRSGPSPAALARRLGLAVSEIGRLVAARRGSRRRPGAGGWRHF